MAYLTKAPSVHAVSSNTTITAKTGHHIYDVDASGGAVTINLPTAVGNRAYLTITKRDSSANTVTCLPNGAETINGYADMIIQFKNSSMDLYNNNANWFID